MIEKLPNIIVLVRDQEKALDFYTNVLGFEKRTDYTPPVLKDGLRSRQWDRSLK